MRSSWWAAAFIGLEAAAALTLAGHRITVIESVPVLLGRVASPILSDYLLSLHRSRGVRVVLGKRVREFAAEDGERVGRVVTEDGTSYPCDMALVGVGAVPNVELALECGLDVEDGVVVDAQGRTSDPDVFAAGDCSNNPNTFAGRRLRLESVQNATDQGRTVGAAIAGVERPYRSVPRFWSDQFDVRLQMAGLVSPGDEQVVRGDPASGAFSVLSHRQGRLVGVECVNRAADQVAGRRILEAGARVDLAQAADISRPLGDLVAA